MQPRVVSISQTTELGTVYTVEEIKALADFAHARGMLLHVDGARIANAAAHLGASLRELTTDLERAAHVTITQKVEANPVFALLPREQVAVVQQRFFFYVWNEETSEVRLMCSFETTEEDVRELVSVSKDNVG